MKARTTGTFAILAVAVAGAVALVLSRSACREAVYPVERAKLAAEAEKVLMATGGVNPVYFYTTPQMMKPVVHDVIRLAGGDVIWTYAYLD